LKRSLRTLGNAPIAFMPAVVRPHCILDARDLRKLGLCQTLWLFARNVVTTLSEF
jgi:hypothetical protein